MQGLRVHGLLAASAVFNRGFKKEPAYSAAVLLLVGIVARIRHIMGLLDLLFRVLDRVGCFRLCSCHDLLHFGLDRCR